ncbi:BLOC-1-related complex subunit 7-like [Liolophura sinensis]|uniref:BLOC-1-related complex subunit 7-like n=1 Tax=Liolophura sinensis TaxID=3198878 RepID=UPI0031587482
MPHRNWNQETKNRLNEKVDAAVTDLGSLARQVVRGSRSSELLAQAAKNFASQESAVQNSLQALRKMGLITSHLQFQEEAIERSMDTLDNIQDQLKTILR